MYVSYVTFSINEWVLFFLILILHFHGFFCIQITAF